MSFSSMFIATLTDSVGENTTASGKVDISQAVIQSADGRLIEP